MSVQYHVELLKKERKFLKRCLLDNLEELKYLSKEHELHIDLEGGD